MIKQFAIACVAVVGLAGPALAEGDAAAGEKVFRKCKACHVADKEQNRVGPHLVDIIGRVSGSVDGFKYSDAMKGAEITWDDTTIAEYLAEVSNTSAVVCEAVREYRARELERRLENAYREDAAENAEINAEWESTDAEVDE